MLQPQPNRCFRVQRSAENYVGVTKFKTFYFEEVGARLTTLRTPLGVFVNFVNFVGDPFFRPTLHQVDPNLLSRLTPGGLTFPTEKRLYPRALQFFGVLQ